MKKLSECQQKKQWDIIVEKWKQQKNDKDKKCQVSAIQNAKKEIKLKVK
tara:strand:- start:292 stop:438 length:147 start_codon:yes stop_codon:yes gene_type:complete